MAHDPNCAPGARGRGDLLVDGPPGGPPAGGADGSLGSLRGGALRAPFGGAPAGARARIPRSPGAGLALSEGDRPLRARHHGGHGDGPGEQRVVHALPSRLPPLYGDDLASHRLRAARRLPRPRTPATAAGRAGPLRAGAAALGVGVRGGGGPLLRPATRRHVHALRGGALPQLYRGVLPYRAGARGPRGDVRLALGAWRPPAGLDRLLRRPLPPDSELQPRGDARDRLLGLPAVPAPQGSPQ